jgi:type VI secretion system secreted protein Hcp
METKRQKRNVAVGLLVLAGLLVFSFLATGGNLDPSAPPGPTMHTLEEIYNLVQANSGTAGGGSTGNFLQVEGIPGGSTDENHQGWIEIESFSFGVHQTIAGTPSSGSGRTTQGCSHQDFTISKIIDKASPKLALFCCTGEHLPNIKLQVCRAGGDKMKYMEYKMEDVIISSITSPGSAGSGDSVPTESISFNFAKIRWSYYEADGSSISDGWDLTTNTPILPDIPGVGIGN